MLSRGPRHIKLVFADKFLNILGLLVKIFITRSQPVLTIHDFLCRGQVSYTYEGCKASTVQVYSYVTTKYVSTA